MNKKKTTKQQWIVYVSGFVSTVNSTTTHKMNLFELQHTLFSVLFSFSICFSASKGEINKFIWVFPEYTEKWQKYREFFFFQKNHKFDTLKS